MEMTAERLFKEQNMLQRRLTEVFNGRVITSAVFDLDGTIVDTHALYIGLMKEYCNRVAADDDVLSNEVYHFMENVLSGLRPVYSVNPALLKESARLAALRYERDYYTPEIQEYLERMMKGIYDEPMVQKFEGVDDTLSLIRAAGADTYLVTHANKTTTAWKLNYTGLDDKFRGVYCVDDLQMKDADAWKRGYEYFGIEPANSIMAGDSWTSDIEPAIAIGVPKDQVFRVKTSYGEANRGRIKGVREINAFYQIIDSILEL